MLENSELLAMLNSGDLVALEAKYHKECLVDLYYRARRCKMCQDGDSATNLCEGIAFSNLLIYIQGKLEESGGDYIFKMIDIVKMYTQYLSDLVGEIKNMEHTTRLREKIQIHFPELKAEKVGRNYILRHEKNKVFSNINDDQELDALAFHRFSKT
ncbi:unnamed protein product [Psylliodes chrysocephalus]|uniref:Uncharacterized protein n=1 Tax=Psylliodes chrysocephalus TaxID=3402493 RepID=A0A9P0CWR8_9CUCU|nr:unnamed protein product [Psylliodes chrysocephala]